MREGLRVLFLIFIWSLVISFTPIAQSDFSWVWVLGGVCVTYQLIWGKEL